MKKLLTILVLMCLALPCFSQAELQSGVQNASPLYSSGTWGTTDMMYIYLPWDYYTSGKKYPIIFFFIGKGEIGAGGSDLPKVLNVGLPMYVSQGKPPISVSPTGDTTRFIVTTLQVSTTYTPVSKMNDWINTLRKYGLEIDTQRIYLTGLSKGGGDVEAFQQSINGWHAAASVSMSPDGIVPTQIGYDRFDDAPIWFFNGDNDQTIWERGIVAYDSLTVHNPGVPYKLTVYPGGHCCWNTYYNPTWTDSDPNVTNSPSTEGVTIYDWMIEYSYDYETGSEGPSLFRVFAGNDTTITSDVFALSEAYVVNEAGDTIRGNYTAMDHPNWTLISKPEGAGYVYISGGFYSVGGQTLNNTYYDGEYMVSLKVQSTTGIWYTDTVVITRVSDNNPVANAGADQVLEDGTTTTTLSGSGADADGTITGYHWTTSSSATITSPNSASTEVTGLSDGNSYTFTLTVTDNNGNTGTDDVIISVNSTPQPGDDTPSYKILIDTLGHFWDNGTIFYQVNDVNSSDIVNTLFDEQDADPRNGVETTTPRSDFVSGASTKSYYPATVVIDLGGTYKLTGEWINNHYGQDSLCILYGSPFHWSTDTLKHSSGGSGWYNFDDTVYTRYLKIFYENKGYQKTSGMVLYGHLVGTDSLSSVNPDPLEPPTKTSFTMGQFIGFNQVGPKEVDSVGSLMRHYNNQHWMDTVTTTHNVDSIKFVFTVFGHPTNNTSTTSGTITSIFFPGAPTDSTVKSSAYFSVADYHQMALDTTGYFDVTQGIPTYAINNGQGKPIDPVNHPDMDATDPKSYDRLARMAWTYAAFYGGVTYPADSMQTPYPEISGLELRSMVENGNEMNQTWSGRQNHYTPQEFIAYSSAYYDGNLNTMGPRMGVKNADPNMIVIQAGTAGASIPYLQGMQYYTYYAREDHSVPFDILNFHAYPTTGSNGSGFEDDAMSPEVYFNKPDNVIKEYVKNATKLFPGMPIWLTEWGYDRNRATKLSVPPINGLDSSQIQAQWIARFWFMLSFTGIQKSTMFQLRNDPLQTMYDSVGYTTFNTTGLTDGHYLGDVYNPGVYATSWYAYPAYYFQRAIWLRLYDYKPDTIVVSNQDSIYVYKYRNTNHPDSVAYAVWSGTQTNRSTSEYAIKTGHANTATQVVKLADKHMLGIENTPTTDGSGNLSLTISETPLMVFTTDSENGGELVLSDGPPPANEPPTANAGGNQTLAEGTTTATLTGDGTDTDGTIASYHWTTASGASITSPNSAITEVTGLANGQSYTFTLTVTDDDGDTDQDQVTITVQEHVNVAPTANAGTDQSLPDGTTTATLTGSGTDTDGSIASYQWTTTSDASISSPNSATTEVTGLSSGNSYVFTLTVTDDDGATDQDQVTVTVAAHVNVAPVANAGSDQSLTSEKTSTTLSGSGTDNDGTISSYQWAKVSGPSVTITSPNSASTSVTGLQKGNTYVFRLTVTDNDGGTDQDQVTVTVDPNRAPTANAGSDQNLSSGTTTATLTGSGSDPDGTVTYHWTTSSGATIVSPNAATTEVTGLSDGQSYTFSLTVTDNNGSTDTDNVTVTVDETPPPAEEPDLIFDRVVYMGNRVLLLFRDKNSGKLYLLQLKY